MTLQTITLTNEYSPILSPEKPEALVVCSKKKSDTRVILECSLDKKTWVSLSIGNENPLFLSERLFYRAFLREGKKQVEPVILQFYGKTENEQVKKVEELAKEPETPQVKKLDKQPVADRVQLRRPPSRDNQSGSSSTSR